jgi:hypothetical protein
MAKWVIRRAADGHAAAEAMYCSDSRPVLHGTGVRSVEEYITELIAPGERVEGSSSRRRIWSRDEIVGFIEISDSRPFS